MPLEVDKLEEEAERIRREMYPDQYENEDDTKKENDGDGDKEDEGNDVGDKKTEDDTGDSGESKETDESKNKDDGSSSDDKPKPDIWEQRYKTLKGKYDKEVPILHSTLKELQEEVRAIKDAAVTKKADKKAILEEDKTDDPDIKYLEDEFPDIHKAVAKMLASKKSNVDPEIDQRLQHVETKVTVSDQTKFVQDLTESCNDWTDIRDDERFTEWLNEVDELTGAPRFQLAVLAQQSLDGKRLGKFYNRFKAEVLKADNSSGEQHGKTEKDLEKHVGMPKSKSGNLPDKSGKDNDILTRGDIKKFYDDAASGKFVGDPEAFKKQEARIHKAMQEGRIA